MVTYSEQIRRYENRVASRWRGADSVLFPADHRVDWNDAPSKFNICIDAARVPLSAGLNSGELRLGESGAHPTGYRPPFVSMEELADFLLMTAGILRRKLTVNWSLNGRENTTHRNTTYSRGTASGGGLYPVVIYPLLRARPGLQAGVYQYDDAHHALARLRLGSFEPSIATAIGLQDADASDILFILTVRFWKSVFKYHNFSYQVMTQDVGACVGSMEQVAHTLGWNTTIIYWFLDNLVGSLLGLDMDKEVPLAIVAVEKGDSSCKSKQSTVTSMEDMAKERLPHICRRTYERSKRTFIPEMLLSVHSETMLEKVRRPILSPSQWPLSIPSAPREIISADLRSLLIHRQTDWGLLRREPPIEAEVLLRVLEFVAYGVQYKSDLYPGRVALPSLRIAVIAQNVAGLEKGVYDYDFTNPGLSQRNTWVSGSTMQSIYALMNHNVDQVSALLVLVGRLDLVLRSLGGRGLRVMNAEAGIAAQRAYIAAAALSLGCGAVLGFDAQRISKILNLDTEAEIPLLLMFIGNRCQDAVAYDSALT